MKTHLLHLLFSTVLACQCLRRRPHAIIAANDGEETVAANDGVGMGLFEVQEGGDLLIPFGEYPVDVFMPGKSGMVKVVGLQIVDEIAANEMSADMSGVIGFLKGAGMGRPVFAGHPYHPDASVNSRWNDRRSRGFVKSIEVDKERNAIRLNTKYNSIGKAEVEDAQFVYHSPEWSLTPIKDAAGKQMKKNGMPLFRPKALRSAGLTNHPNIPVPSIISANEDAPAASSLADSIKAALVKEGLIKEDDSDDVILQFIGTLISSLAYARDAKQREADQCAAMAAALPDAGNEATHEDLVTALIAANEGLQSKLTEAANDITAANEAVKAERTQRVNAVLDPLLKAGKVRLHQRDEVIGQLVVAANEAEFQSVLSEAQKTPSKLQTAAKLTADLGSKGKLIIAANEQSARKAQRDEAVNDCLAEITKGRAAKTGDKDRAWNLARSRTPELFTH